MELDSRKIRYLLLTMFLLQEIWLVAIWLGGAASDHRKLIIVAGYSLVCFLGIFFLSAGMTLKIRSLYEWLEQRPILFLLLLGILFLGVSLIYVKGQRIWTDESENFIFTSHWVSDGLSYYWQRYAQYGWVHLQPPLILLLNGLSMLVFGVDLQVIRWATVPFSLGTLVVTYLLGRTLYSRSIGLLAAVYLITFPLFIRMGTAGMLDVQLAFFFCLALLLTVLILRKPSYKLAIALGLTLGLGMLTKYIMITILPIIIFMVLDAVYRSAPNRLQALRQVLLPFLVAGVISGSIFLVWSWNASKIGVTTPLTSTIRLFNQNHANQVDVTPKETVAEKPSMAISMGWFILTKEGLKFTLNSLLTRLPSSIGLYNFPLILLGAVLFLKRRSKEDISILVWITTISLLLLISIPDHRYFMPVFPALTILIACWLDRNPHAIERTTLLALLFQAGALYVLIDWDRLKSLFDLK